MDGNKGLPVAGYRPTQEQWRVDLVNELAVMEERFLRLVELIRDEPLCDARSAAVAITNLQQARMWAARAVFRPQRVDLPEEA